jgi:simple sugar transport system ATP-binding protein
MGEMIHEQSGAGDGQIPRLALDGISKAFPGCLANDDITLSVLPGEIHALLGENGAGKSTLVKIVYGLLQADSGEIRWNGAPVAIPSPAAARKLGIGMVFQHFSLFETLTVAENIALGINHTGPIRELARRVAEVAASYGLDIAPDRPVHTLSVGERQRVEIVRCLLQDPSLIIMDEPTSVLTPQEVTVLFETLRRLAAEGRSILYISHRLEEIRALCSRATILRGGRVVHECDPRAETAARLAALMVGNEIALVNRAPAAEAGAVRLTVDGLNMPADGPFGTAIRDVHFEVRAGEILGIAGVAGNGQRELMQALLGEARTAAAEILFSGAPVGELGPKQRRGLGMAFVPDERMGHGAVPEMTLAENALLTGYRTRGLVERGMIRSRPTRRFADAILDTFRVVAGGTRAHARSLSGGNLQKFIIGREMLQAPQLFIAASPTWGVDAGAAAAIRQSLVDLAAAGAAVLIVSQDLEELLEIADRIAVIAGGRLSPAMSTQEATPERLGLLMAGTPANQSAALEQPAP